MSTPMSPLVHQVQRLCRAGQVAKAFELSRRALDSARPGGNPIAVAEAMNALAYVHFRVGHYEEAKGLLVKSISMVPPEHPSRVDALILLGLCAAETDDPDGAGEYYRSAVDLSRQMGYDEALYRGLHNLAVGVYIPRGQFALALAVDRDAYEFILSRGKKELGWGALAAMGWVYWTMGRPREAARMARLLEDIAPEGSLSRGFHDALLADLALDEGRVDDAAGSFAKARSVAHVTGDPGLNGLVCLGLSRLYRSKGDPAAALGWAEETLTLARRVGYVHLQGMALLARARSFWLSGDLNSTEEDLRSAIGMMTPLGLDYDLATAWLLLAALLHQQGRNGTDAWIKAASLIRQGHYHFLLERERSLAFPLIAHYAHHSGGKAREEAHQLLRHLTSVPPPPLRIHTLGRFEVWQGARRIPDGAWSKRRAGVLFRLLLISPRRSRTQEQIVEALWPDKDMTAAQPLLHQATSALRRALEPDLPRSFPSRYLTVEEASVTLHLPPGSWVEHEVFEEQVQRGAFQEAVALYRGKLFPQDPYADWAVWERERLAQSYLRALLGASRDALAANRPAEALALARQALKLEPWQEQATRLGMEACLAMGDRTGALRLYRALAERLQKELGIEPGADLRAFYRKIAGIR